MLRRSFVIKGRVSRGRARLRALIARPALSQPLPPTSSVPEHDCYHCGQPIPDDVDLVVDIEGTPHHMCCTGCQAVAQSIVSSGLIDYYKRRDAVALTVAQFRHYQSDPAKLREIRAEHKTELQLIPAMKAAEGQLKQLREAKKRAKDRAAEREIEARMRVVMDRFNAAYHRVVTRGGG